MITLLFHVLIVLLILALIWWVLGMIGLPAPITKVATIILVIIGCLYLILILAKMAGVSTGINIS